MKATPHNTITESTTVTPLTEMPLPMDAANFFESADFYQPAALVGLLIVITIFFLISWRKKRQFHDRLITTEKELRTLREELEELQQNYTVARHFQQNMKNAGLTVQLQQKTTTTEDKIPSQPPERYHYAQRLAQRGMHSEEIAATLAISAHEAAQVVSLTRLAA